MTQSSLAVGDRLPDAVLAVLSSEGVEKRDVNDLFAGRKVVLFAVPGAFSPTCHRNHLPGFLSAVDEFRAEGVESIFCLAVNDPFVLAAWAEKTEAAGRIGFLADGNGEFTQAVGMELDASAFGMGRRSRRYAMLVDDRTVSILHAESEAGRADESSAQRLLDVMRS